MQAMPLRLAYNYQLKPFLKTFRNYTFINQLSWTITELDEKV